MRWGVFTRRAIVESDTPQVVRVALSSIGDDLLLKNLTVVR